MQKATLDKGNEILRSIAEFEALLIVLRDSNAIAFGPGNMGYSSYTRGTSLREHLGESDKTVVFNLASKSAEQDDPKRLFHCAKTLFVAVGEQTLTNLRKEFDELKDAPVEALEAAVK
ncbi:hypothetical protein UFOVP1492_88 [uncultured Caudovirales phage]|uniref:Uncharacterized protein n=1 Tax=uncultured Caudovirales phage TaxID=2100421 RepID=A0A6J5SQI2_9CAUD|nr:hypothetical protein UFOVP1127_46 [uncultured Caudovirales phage]CAB4193133.1 hypothetical protein UFOVP1242_28 [uncultured Caudovirales phage]CAB4217782.1 hypothetical protein UFOVP1492_88 [uncultured Caudovirales phage]CAB5231608.1 hypothetical protein UFOVP1580_117 [uncultured Caudovirales phage]